MRGPKGQASSSDCPRKGKVWLTKIGTGTLVIPTTCKTWGCLACRERLMALFKMRVTHGCSVLGDCAFITLTFVLRGAETQEDAESVSKAWREFWRRWMSQGHERLQWLRVVELTKKGQPHLHLIAGPVSGKIRCYGNERLDAQWFDRVGRAGCLCLSHRMSRVWESITGAWHVHTAPVTGAAGAAGYLGKYLSKGAYVRQGLEALGFKRRWSSSRGWPGNGRLRLKQTMEGGWDYVDMFPGAGRGRQHLEDHYTEVSDKGLAVRVGTDIAVALAKRGRMKRIVGNLQGRLSNAADDS